MEKNLRKFQQCFTKVQKIYMVTLKNIKRYRNFVRTYYENLMKILRENGGYLEHGYFEKGRNNLRKHMGKTQKHFRKIESYFLRFTVLTAATELVAPIWNYKRKKYKHIEKVK